MQSSLAKLIPESMDCYKIKREAWQNDKILVLTPDQAKRLSQQEYELIKRIGDRLYAR